MSRLRLREDAPAAPFVSERPRISYVVLRRLDVWFIEFGGSEYGPYKTQREAMLFAVDAAYKLGEQGHDTEVLVQDGNAPRPAWIYGKDSYPPRSAAAA